MGQKSKSSTLKDKSCGQPDKYIYKKKPVAYKLSCKKKHCLVVIKGKDYYDSNCSDRHSDQHKLNHCSSSIHHKKHHKSQPCKLQYCKPQKQCKSEKPSKLTVIQHCNGNQCEKRYSESESESNDSKDCNDHCSSSQNSFSEKYTDSESEECSCCSHN